MMDDTFDAKDLALKPEHLVESGRLADTGIAAAKRERRKKEFSMKSRGQFERLVKTKNAASWKVFDHLLFLNWRSPGGAIRLANDALEQIGVDRYAKYRALAELESLGLIEIKKRGDKSPDVFVKDL